MKEVPETVIVTDPAYFEALDELVSDETFPQMKSWMLVAMGQRRRPLPQR